MKYRNSADASLLYSETLSCFRSESTTTKDNVHLRFSFHTQGNTLRRGSGLKWQENAEKQPENLRHQSVYGYLVFLHFPLACS